MTEAELCQAFRDRVQKLGWIVYPETGGFDMLLVATGKTGSLGVKPDDQVGVEAKLRGNVKVLAQAYPGLGYSGPKFVGVLIPKASQEFRHIACLLKLNVWTANDYAGLPLHTNHPLDTRTPCWLPPVVPRHAAGLPSPQSLTPWKVKAIQLCNLLDTGALVTRKEIHDLNLDPRLWIDMKWIVETDEKRGRSSLLKKADDPGPKWPSTGFEVEAGEIAILDKEDSK